MVNIKIKKLSGGYEGNTTTHSINDCNLNRGISKEAERKTQEESINIAGGAEPAGGRCRNRGMEKKRRGCILGKANRSRILWFTLHQFCAVITTIHRTGCGGSRTKT